MPALRFTLKNISTVFITFFDNLVELYIFYKICYTEDGTGAMIPL